MKKVFLSHSSKDKTYVEHVAQKLGYDNCVYDKYTFEDGMKTLDEIYRNLDKTDIFVFFISDISLESDWVKKERTRMKNLLDEGKILQFYPIILDVKVSHDDERIPRWMKKSYNIRPILSWNLAANKIRARMREVVWKENPRLKYRSNLFIGRNMETEKFEERRSDFDKQELKCIVASSAFGGIGRKAYMSHVLKKGSMMSESYRYNLISLEQHESIEDFILKISDLGSGFADIVSVSSMSLPSKIEVAVRIVKMIQQHNEFIFIDDHGVIIKPNSEMAEWFAEILRGIEPKIVFGIASTFYLTTRKTDETVFAIRIPELDKKEIRLLLKEYCNLNDLDLSLNEMKEIGSHLSGYPEQIFYAVQMVKDIGIKNTLLQSHEIEEYADDKATVILERFVNTDEKMEFLVFLSRFDFIGYEILEVSYEKNSSYKDYMDQFLAVSICEFIGMDGEYIRVNNVLKDILFRQKLSMGDKLENLYKNLLNRTVDDAFLSQTDLAGYYNVVKEKLENGSVDEKYVMPSHYLKCIVHHYNLRRYDKASRLCEKVIEGERLNTYDEELVYAIYRYYCQSLAREHKFKEFHGVMDSYSKFKPEDREFLFGFFHRINGNPKRAIESLKRALKMREVFPQARRELANAYITAEDYESARRHCKRNYLDDPRNPYFIHPYFETLVRQYIAISNRIVQDGKEVEKLVKQMEQLLCAIQGSSSQQGKQMCAQMCAEYEAYVNKDFDEAMKIIQEEIQSTSGFSIYLLMTQFDIAYRWDNVNFMGKSIQNIEKVVSNQKYFSNAMNIRKARYYAALGDEEEATIALEKVKNMPQETIDRIKMEISFV